MISISYIIPTFNNLKLLKRCIASIQEQLQEDDKIIIIDDGSTDGTNEYLLKNYKKDKSFIILTQENSGSGVARNLGLKYSKTNYIWFIDADDYIERNIIYDVKKKLYNKKYDLLIFNYKKVDNGMITEVDIKIDTNDINTLFLTNHYPWNKIIKRNLFNGIEFPKEKIRFQDHGTMPILISKAKNIGFYEEALYYYDFSHEGNITKGIDKKGDIFLACNNLVKYRNLGYLEMEELELILINTLIYNRLFDLENKNLKNFYYYNLKKWDYLSKNLVDWKNSKYLNLNFLKKYKNNINHVYIKYCIGTIFKHSTLTISLLLFLLFKLKDTFGLFKNRITSK